MNKPAGLAVQFGAGNIGRGFVGQLLSQAGYLVVFVDVIDSLVDQINQQGQYTIKTIEPDQTERVVIKDVRAINGKDQAAVVEAIVEAKIITTAVGPNVLQHVAPAIARGLEARAARGDQSPLNVIACENLIGNSTILYNHVQEHLAPDTRDYVGRYVGFPCCVVDKVVTNPTEADLQEDSLIAVAEKGGKLIVDRDAFVGPLPVIAGVQFTDNLDAYVEQKIFTLNTAHAITAYLGYARGIEFIHQAIQDREIRSLVSKALVEVQAVLVKRHNLDPADQEQYVAGILQRFENATIPDPVVRVGREPIRKLSPGDRLVQPAVLAQAQSITPTGLAAGIAAALLYDNPDDEQAVALQNSLRDRGLAATLQEVSQLDAGHPLVALIQEQLAVVRALATLE
jgi:mannitol-1-phosphate 5-dehydrogenase